MNRYSGLKRRNVACGVPRGQILSILLTLRAVGLSNVHFNGQRIVVASMASAYAQTYTLRYRLAGLHLINIRQDHTE
jgi:hypothetical protein